MRAGIYVGLELGSWGVGELDSLVSLYEMDISNFGFGLQVSYWRFLYIIE